MSESTENTTAISTVATASAQRSAAQHAAQPVPFRLSISIPLTGLKLGVLQRLRTGAIFPSDVPAAEDVPVRVGGALLGWAEMDNVDGRMAVRLTRLS